LKIIIKRGRNKRKRKKQETIKVEQAKAIVEKKKEKKKTSLSLGIAYMTYYISHLDLMLHCTNQSPLSHRQRNI
jgi:hypothetical protein